MISVKNRQLDKETIEVLNELLEKDINALAAFKLMKVVKDLDEIVKNRQKSEINLIRKYAVKDEDGNILQNNNNGFQVEDSEVENFNNEMDELRDHINELNYDTFDISDLGIEKISAKKLMKLDFLFN